MQKKPKPPASRKQHLKIIENSLFSTFYKNGQKRLPNKLKLWKFILAIDRANFLVKMAESSILPLGANSFGVWLQDSNQILAKKVRNQRIFWQNSENKKTRSQKSVTKIFTVRGGYASTKKARFSARFETNFIFFKFHHFFTFFHFFSTFTQNFHFFLTIFFNFFRFLSLFFSSKMINFYNFYNFIKK